LIENGGFRSEQAAEKELLERKEKYIFQKFKDENVPVATSITKSGIDCRRL
jgi:hypothetical protein